MNIGQYLLISAVVSRVARRPTGSHQIRRENCSADAEADVANGFAAGALFQFSQDFGLGDLFELVSGAKPKHSIKRQS